MTKPLTLYFIRHGETQYNTERRMQGFCDSPLTERGIHQAKSVGAGLSHIPFEKAYASDSQRVLDTAKYAIAERKILLTKDIRLKEMNFGILEAMVQDEMELEHKTMLETLFSFEDLDCKIDQGESYNELLHRTTEAVNEIIKTHEETGGNILIFSHGVTIGYYMKTLLNDGSFPPHDNCSVSVVQVNNGTPYVVKVADTSFRDNGEKLLQSLNQE